MNRSVTLPTTEQPVDPEIWELSNQLVAAAKLLTRLRNHAAQTSGGVEDTHVYAILFRLQDGPLRVSDLAEAVRSDTSTVSRQISAMRERGLISKVADDQDRRVQLVRLTDQGRAMVCQLRTQRTQWLAHVVSDWQSSDIKTFRHYLERFAADIDRVTSASM